MGCSSPSQLGPLVGHLEEEQEGELLQVVLVGEPVVAEDVAVGPELLDQAIGLAHADFFFRGLRAGFFLALAAAWAVSRSALMRSSRTEAGSSFGSWSTSLPSKAHLRMD